MQFYDRIDAGRQLADALDIKDPDHTLVLALPRGGIPLGIEVAEKYHLPFDTIMSKKIGHPFHSEYAIGAVSEHGDPILNETQIKRVESKWLDNEVNHLRKKMARRRSEYSKVLQEQSVRDKSVILVDDGIATGMTMKAAIKAVKEQGASKVSVAVPVIPKDTYEELRKQADEVVALEVPEVFLGAVGAYYRRFPQVEDNEVMTIMKSFSQQK